MFTRAGDAFTAGIVTDRTMPDAINQGCRAGAFCVTRRGVIAGLPRPENLDAFA
jgi:sugar/nucleoside kinase (ribokinase family)